MLWKHGFERGSRISPVLFMLSCSLLLLAQSCEKEIFIVPSEGYSWPDNNRSYWPTEAWKLADMEDHGMDPSKMSLADEFAENDSLARALLVIKDGYIVFEKYYDEGGVNESTDVWSVAKSYTSALVGLLMDQKVIQSTSQLMADLLPAYPEFKDIRLHHVLTMTTGLSWQEYGRVWVEWIFSDDWVAHALALGQEREPGEAFFYSSANSHFLTSMVYYMTGIKPGTLAKEKLFDPMGIPFDTLDGTIIYENWNEYQAPMNQTWRQDTRGIETASFGLYMTARDMAKFGYLYLNRGRWEDRQVISENWVLNSTRDHETNIYGRYSYGYHWYLTLVAGKPVFMASGFGGQVIGVVPSQDLVLVLKYEAETPVHPESGSANDDMHLFELVVKSVI